MNNTTFKLLCVALCFLSSNYPKTTNIDFLRTNWQNTELVNITSLDALKHLITYNYVYNRSSIAILLFQKYFNLSRWLGNIIYQANTVNTIGIAYCPKGNSEKTTNYLEFDDFYTKSTRTINSFCRV